MDTTKYNITSLSSLQINSPSKINANSLQGIFNLSVFNKEQIDKLESFLKELEAKRLPGEKSPTAGIMIYDGEDKVTLVWDGTEWQEGEAGGNIRFEGDISAIASNAAFLKRDPLDKNMVNILSAELRMNNTAPINVSSENNKISLLNSNFTSDDEQTLTNLQNIQTLQFGSLDLAHKANVGIVMLDSLTSQTIFMQVDKDNNPVTTTVFGSGLPGSSSSPSATLEINTNEGALLVSRLTQKQIDNLSHPVNGMIVYNTDKKDFSFYQNGEWIGHVGGDVSGPKKSTPNNFAIFANGDGTLINDSGITIPTTQGKDGYILSTDGKGQTSWIPQGGGGAITDFYHTPGTFTWKKKAGMTYARIIMIGGGGGGRAPGRGESRLPYNNGGAGAACYEGEIVNISTLPDTATIIVGKGGKGGINSQEGEDGEDGGDSSFSFGTTSYIAKGGKGGTIRQAPATDGVPNIASTRGGYGGKSGDGTNLDPVTLNGGNAVYAAGGGGGSSNSSIYKKAGDGGSTTGVYNTFPGIGGTDGIGGSSAHPDGTPGSNGIGWVPYMGSVAVGGPGGGGGGSGAFDGKGANGGNGGLFGGGGGSGGGSVAITVNPGFRGNGGNGGNGCVLIMQW